MIRMIKDFLSGRLKSKPTLLSKLAFWRKEDDYNEPEIVITVSSREDQTQKSLEEVSMERVERVETPTPLGPGGGSGGHTGGVAVHFSGSR